MLHSFPDFLPLWTTVDGVSHQQIYDELCQHLRETALLESAQYVLEWDERTCLPPRGGTYRAEQIAYLARTVHQRRTDPRIGEWLQQLQDWDEAADRHSVIGCTTYWVSRDYEKQRKLPVELVEALSRETTLGQQVWSEARRDDNFAAFQPNLTRILELKREQAQAIGYEQSPYDALLDDYEPATSTEEVSNVLGNLRDALVPLVRLMSESPRQPDTTILQRHYPTSVQKEFASRVVATMGFDFDRGRLDPTSHPFCTSLGPDDCRITTRYDEHFFPSAFFGTLHEAGHGMYDQGLPSAYYGLPPGMYVSLGIHESQSRLWENLVGRRHAFWKHFFPEAQAAFPESLGDVTLDAFHFAVNAVRPSLIRVEADEVTYNLHIVIRFELERALIEGDLTVADLPVAWNEAYEKNLGIRPPSDADGVLQDIHWSAGLFGYFPTYSLGNIVAAQLYQAASQALDDLEGAIAAGQFRPLLEWLRKHVHECGRRYLPGELVERATGGPIDHTDLLRDLKCRIGRLYETA